MGDVRPERAKQHAEGGEVQQAQNSELPFVEEHPGLSLVHGVRNVLRQPLITQDQERRHHQGSESNGPPRLEPVQQAG